MYGRRNVVLARDNGVGLTQRIGVSDTRRVMHVELSLYPLGRVRYYNGGRGIILLYTMGHNVFREVRCLWFTRFGH